MPTDLGKTVLHRVQYIELNELGEKIFVTKGDNNNTLDPWGIQEHNIKGIEVKSIPLVGYILNFIRSPAGVFLFFIIPSVYIIFVELQKMKAIALKNQLPRLKSRGLLLSREKPRLDPSTKVGGISPDNKDMMKKGWFGNSNYSRNFLDKSNVDLNGDFNKTGIPKADERIVSREIRSILFVDDKIRGIW